MAECLILTHILQIDVVKWPRKLDAIVDRFRNSSTEIGVSSLSQKDVGKNQG